VEKQVSDIMTLITEIPTRLDIAEIFELVRLSRSAVFLDSSLRNTLGRYSIIGLDPYLTIEEKATTAFVDGVAQREPFLTVLKAYLHEHYEANPSNLPLISGCIGYLNYEFGRSLVGVRSRHEHISKLPDCRMVFYSKLIIADHSRNKTYLADATGDDDGLLAFLDGCATGLSSEQGLITAPGDTAAALPGYCSSDFARDDYLTALDRMIHYIKDGDIYIANMTRRIHVKSDVDPYDFFCRLRRQNPSPFGAYLDYGDTQVICASPERFLLLKDGLVSTRPIKGTRPRGETPEKDHAMRQELINSEKDRSELLMIVDLERNDLSMVCELGSVSVTELFALEEYATVFHLVSTIEGRLAPTHDICDLLKSAFPGGSITGAPKHRALQIIDELENSARGLYTGAIGYIGLDGNSDMNIVIRTAVHDGDSYEIGVGGGITAESDVIAEYDETSQKAKALLNALGVLP
jgi:para-aminobenzoate synthetase component 1